MAGDVAEEELLADAVDYERGKGDGDGAVAHVIEQIVYWRRQEGGRG